MITCVIRYQIDPTKKAQFDEYARNWGQAIPRCGADLIGWFAPHEGSTTLAYGIYSIESLAAYEQYRQRLVVDPIGRANNEFAMRGTVPCARGQDLAQACLRAARALGESMIAGHLRSRSPLPHRHQSVSRHLEFRCGPVMRRAFI